MIWPVAAILVNKKWPLEMVVGKMAQPGKMKCFPAPELSWAPGSVSDQSFAGPFFGGAPTATSRGMLRCLREFRDPAPQMCSALPGPSVAPRDNAGTPQCTAFAPGASS